MDHIRRSRPAVATVAATAAITIMLTTTTAPPSNPTMVSAAPRITTENVQLVALPAALAAVAHNRAGAGQVANDVPDASGALTVIFNAAVSGAAVGAFVAFSSAARWANGVTNIPVIGPLLQPILALVVYFSPWVVGAPIGAMVGAFSAVKTLLAGLVPPPLSAASARAAVTSRNTVTTPQRSAKSGTRSSRHTAKPVTPAKTSAGQQSVGQSRAGSARGHAAAANRAARH